MAIIIDFCNNVILVAINVIGIDRKRTSIDLMWAERNSLIYMHGLLIDLYLSKYLLLIRMLKKNFYAINLSFTDVGKRKEIFHLLNLFSFRFEIWLEIT